MTAPQKLVGGHATRNLTAEEARKLYEAALGDQVLFDELMDEEALKALLEDPDVRRTLLSALHARPWWRRPWALAAAATMLAVGLATWNGLGEGPTLYDSRENQKAEVSTPAPAEKAGILSIEKDQAPASEPSANMAAERTGRKPLPGIDVQEETPPPVPQPIPSSAPVLPAPDRSEFHLKQSPAPSVALRSHRTEGNAIRTELIPQEVRGLWKLEPLTEGGWRLQVTQAPGRCLYLLQMDQDGPPQAIPQATDGSFRISPRQGRTWELLVLKAPAADPVAVSRGYLPPDQRIPIKP